ncbi:MAG: hypothetical protein JO140_00140 [Candidatus Eremiobacteraeota bacterium]|nr:hypothetical protein [Candidatus Eremiobacteraeota bacterium]
MSAPTQPLALAWRTCGDARAWCRFETAVLPDAPASGILLVWSGSHEEERRCVYLAQGPIASNLKWARQFERICTLPELFVSWATLPEALQSGVRNYLLVRLQPLFCDRATCDEPITVELPWNRNEEWAPR